jgi:hypothetical protein
MIAETQAALAKSVRTVASAGTAVRAFTLANPIAVAGGVILGAVAYYAVNKYWLNKEEDWRIQYREAEENEAAEAVEA